MHRMLAGAAAGLQHVAGFAVKIPLQHGPDRLMVAMKRLRIKPAVRLDGAAILAEFDDILRHPGLPSRACGTALVLCAAAGILTAFCGLETPDCQKMAFVLFTTYIFS